MKVAQNFKLRSPDGSVLHGMRDFNGLEPSNHYPAGLRKN